MNDFNIGDFVSITFFDGIKKGIITEFRLIREINAYGIIIDPISWLKFCERFKYINKITDSDEIQRLQIQYKLYLLRNS
jgi:hypothetical protein